MRLTGLRGAVLAVRRQTAQRRAGPATESVCESDIAGQQRNKDGIDLAQYLTPTPTRGTPRSTGALIARTSSGSPRP